MSFPAYPEYKDSGVPWLGEVPGHWELSRIGSRFSERREKVSDTEYPPLSVTKNGIVPQLDTAAKTDDNDNRKCVLAGDFVINSRSDRKGSSGLSALDGSVSLINTVIRPDSTMHGQFVHHLFRSVAFQEEYYRYGKGIVADLWSTNYGEMKAITLAVPPLEEQAAIAAFLDRETAKIDALVAEQERLIALLKEKRQAVISYAVTKGLNPDAPMKDSGIEWLGEIPAHWEVVALNRLIDPYRRITYGIVQPGQPDPNGRFMIRGQDYSQGWADPSTVFRVSDEVEIPYRRARLQQGDIVMTIVGAGTGNTAVVPEQYDGANITQTTARIASNAELCCADYLTFALASSGGKTQVGLFQKGAAQPGLNLEHLKAFFICLPPKDEQEQIAAHLSAASRLDDDVREAAQVTITLLQERRAALISAAVTGKIDVRIAVTSSKVVSIKSTRLASIVPTLRVVVGAYAIQELGPMGRMAVMKAGFLAEAYAGFSDLNGRYERFAAGPYDRNLLEAMEHGAHELCGIVTHEPRSAGEAVTYDIPSTATAAPGEALRELVGEDAAARFREMLSLLKGIGRDGVEAVATIYAVWNDLLADGQAADDEMIFRGVLTDWHPEKAKKFKLSDLAHWLAWMRRHEFVPDGSAPRTDNQPKLF